MENVTSSSKVNRCSLTSQLFHASPRLSPVDYSTLNYKDALVASGNYAGLKLPMVGGIDLAGTVKQSDSPKFAAGDKVFGYGWGMGTDHFGSYAEMASVRSQWLSKLAPGMGGTFDAASIGTAGYTAMLCIDALIRNGLEKGSGPVLVTGKITEEDYERSFVKASCRQVRQGAWDPSPPRSSPTWDTRSWPSAARPTTQTPRPS